MQVGVGLVHNHEAEVNGGLFVGRPSRGQARFVRGEYLVRNLVGVNPKTRALCCGRGRSLYGRSGVDLALICREFGPLPLLGFFTYAELAPVQGIPCLHHYTGVLVLVSEDR